VERRAESVVVPMASAEAASSRTTIEKKHGNLPRDCPCRRCWGGFTDCVLLSCPRGNKSNGRRKILARNYPFRRHGEVLQTASCLFRGAIIGAKAEDLARNYLFRRDGEVS
jgi:hypothetical protein